MNPSRRPLICGNWKMFKGAQAGVDLAQDIVAFAKDLPKVDLVIAPPFTVIAAISTELENSTVKLAGQNMHPKNDGAFTGEISGPFLKDCGCTWVIVGHSERRAIFGETDAIVADKAAAALGAGLLPIICVGETLQQREGGETLRIVKQQVDAFLDVIAQSSAAVAIAYEPVWAIGTGRTATPPQAQEVHAHIRSWLSAKYGADAANAVRIQYGGSVKASNAEQLMAEKDIDGALVGGASLEAADFIAIVKAARPS